MSRLLTDASRSALAHVAREHRAGGWARARSHGERVSLASLYARGYIIRRAWRGAEGQPDAAYEYRLTPELADAVERKRAADTK